MAEGDLPKTPIGRGRLESLPHARKATPHFDWKSVDFAVLFGYVVI